MVGDDLSHGAELGILIIVNSSTLCPSTRTNPSIIYGLYVDGGWYIVITKPICVYIQY